MAQLEALVVNLSDIVPVSEDEDDIAEHHGDAQGNHDDVEDRKRMKGRRVACGGGQGICKTTSLVFIHHDSLENDPEVDSPAAHLQSVLTSAFKYLMLPSFDLMYGSPALVTSGGRLSPPSSNAISTHATDSARVVGLLLASCGLASV